MTGLSDSFCFQDACLGQMRYIVKTKWEGLENLLKNSGSWLDSCSLYSHRCTMIKVHLCIWVCSAVHRHSFVFMLLSWILCQVCKAREQHCIEQASQILRALLFCIAHAVSPLKYLCCRLANCINSWSWFLEIWEGAYVGCSSSLKSILRVSLKNRLYRISCSTLYFWRKSFLSLIARDLIVQL